MTGLFRKFRSLVPFGSASEETFSFARFHNEPDDTELSCFQSNGVAKEGIKDSVPPRPAKGSSADGRGPPEESLAEIGHDHGAGREEEGSQLNRISEWQAGWNVTNAIQVSVVSFVSKKLYCIFKINFRSIFI